MVMILRCTQSEEVFIQQFFEKHVVYFDPIGAIESVGSGIWKVGEVGVKAVDVGLDTVNLTADVLKWLLDLPKHIEKVGKLGWAYGKYLKDKMVHNIKKPDLPTWSMPEYQSMWKPFSKDPGEFGLTEKKAVNAGTLHVGAVYMELHVKSIATFIEPAQTEYLAVLEEIKARRKARIARKKRRAELEAKVERCKAAIAGGHSEDDPEGEGDDFFVEDEDVIDWQGDLARHQTELDTIQEDITAETEWNVPELRSVEYPPGSGKKVLQFYSNPKKRRVMDLIALKGYLEGYLGGFEAPVKKYTDQAHRCAYWRDAAYGGIKDPDQKARFEEYVRTINSEAAAIKFK